MCTKTLAKMQCILFAIMLCAEVANGVMTVTASDVSPGPSGANIISYQTWIAKCSKQLSHLIFRVCSGALRVSDTPEEELAKVRPRRAALFMSSLSRVRRQIVDECCHQPCTISNLVNYCPDEW